MLDTLRPALIITRREVRDQFRDWRIIVPIFFLTLVFPAIMNFTARSAVNFVAEYGADIVADRLIPFLLMVVGFFPISVSLVIALESFVGEKERRSIEPLLSSPLSNFQMYLGKLIAVMIPPLLASYLGIGVYLYGVFRNVGWAGEPILIVQIILLTTVQALVMVSGAVVISTQATSVRAANLLASFIIIPMAFVIQGEAMVMFWAQYDVLWIVIFGMVVLAGLLLRTGISHFNREELLGRELDTINLRFAWQTFWMQFKGDATSLGGWYRGQVFPTLRKLTLPILFVAAFLVVATLLGMGQAANFSIPAEFLNLENLQITDFGELNDISLLSANSVPIIIWHNTRVFLIALLLSLISFGVFGLIILMLPILLIGFFMATFSSAGISPLTFLAGLILPHGIFEIPAIVLMGAALLFMGAKVAAPSRGLSIGDSWVMGLAEWLKVYLGVVLPLLILASVMEVFVTPQIAVMLLTR
jgi:uncharacterized membrane protein SpoIIM required for sporulation